MNRIRRFFRLVRANLTVITRWALLIAAVVLFLGLLIYGGEFFTQLPARGWWIKALFRVGMAVAAVGLVALIIGAILNRNTWHRLAIVLVVIWVAWLIPWHAIFIGDEPSPMAVVTTPPAATPAPVISPSVAPLSRGPEFAGWTKAAEGTIDPLGAQQDKDTVRIWYVNSNRVEAPKVPTRLKEFRFRAAPPIIYHMTVVEGGKTLEEKEIKFEREGSTKTFSSRDCSGKWVPITEAERDHALAHATRLGFKSPDGKTPINVEFGFQP